MTPAEPSYPKERVQKLEALVTHQGGVLCSHGPFVLGTFPDDDHWYCMAMDERTGLLVHEVAGPTRESVESAMDTFTQNVSVVLPYAPVPGPSERHGPI